jgi:membrane fusion protein
MGSGRGAAAVSLKVTTSGALILIILFLLIAKSLARSRAVGELTSTTGTAKIFVPQRGTTREVHVQEGDVVQVGSSS